ncbi:MAG: hypothetical protein IPM12_02615 [Flavobacteriales bacterium]|nr:hypothetical protein [Flavobacteriales bacterium]
MNLLQPSVNSAAALASTPNPITQVLAPLAQKIRTVEARLNVEAGSAHEALKVEEGIADAKQNEQLADILLPSWTDPDAKDRVGAIEIFKALFPWYSTRLPEALGRFAANDSLRFQAETAVAQAEGVGGNAFLTDREPVGVETFAGGDATVASSRVTKAYAACPTLDSLEGIMQKLDIVNANGPASVNRIICRFVKERSKRMRADIQARLNQGVGQP